MTDITQEQDEILRKYFTKHYIVYGTDLIKWNEDPDNHEVDETLWDKIMDFPNADKGIMRWVDWAKQNKYIDWKDTRTYKARKLTDKFIDEVINGKEDKKEEN